MKIPGPFGPPFINRPNRKITARSYSWTILMQKINDTGKVIMIKKIEKNIKILSLRLWSEVRE